MDKIPRNINEINAEYGPLCAQSGELQFKIACDTVLLTKINQRLAQLHAEANALNEAKKQEQDQKVSEEALQKLPDEVLK